MKAFPLDDKALNGSGGAHSSSNSTSTSTNSRQKNLTPALSTLLSSTTIPATRTKRRRRQSNSQTDGGSSYFKAQNTNSVDSLMAFSKQELPQAPSQIRSRLNRPTASFSIQHASSGDEDDLPSDHEPLFEIDYASTPLWQLLEEDQDGDSLSTGSSLSSVGSTDSPDYTTSRPKRLVKRSSMGRLVQGNRTASAPQLTLADSEEVQDHPLAGESDSDEDMSDGDSQEPKMMTVFLSELKQRFKAFTNAAASLSSGQQYMVNSSDVFPFSPRATDEPIPVCGGGRGMGGMGDLMQPVAAPVRRKRPQMKRALEAARARVEHLKQLKQQQLEQQAAQQQQSLQDQISQPLPEQPLPVSPQQEQNTQTQTPAPGVAKPKAIALQTYSVEEFELPPPRSREIRENPDFLRIYALESFMRQRHKLLGSQGHAPQVPASLQRNKTAVSSKAQVVLMPRGDEVPEQRFPKFEPPVVEDMSDASLGEVRKIPSRWVGISIDDV